jgi:hypothetical protein
MRFSVEVDGHTIVVVVHQTEKGLVAAANRYDGALDWSGSAACFQQSLDSRCTGIIRLSLEEISFGVLAHEVVHAAAHICRIEENRNPDLSWDTDISDEEDYADLVEKLMDAITPRLLDVLTPDR